MWAIQQKADLEATISLLEQNKAIKPSGDADESAPIVSYANNKEKIGPDGFTDQQRKQFESLLEVKRKFSKRRRGDQSHDQSRVRKDYSKDKLGTNQCAFCRKEGHFQADCSVYRRLQFQYLSGKEESESESDERLKRKKGKEKAHVAYAGIARTPITGRRMTDAEIKDAGI